MTTLNWNVPFTSAVKRPVSLSYELPMLVTTRSNMISVFSSTGPMLSESPAKKATRFGIGGEIPGNNK